MAANTRDAQAGWLVYRGSAFTASLEQINAQVTRDGFNAVSERMYSHYRKLARYGYERYVPINQLDMATLRDPIWDAPLRNRYRSRPTKLGARVVIVLGEITATLEGQVVEMSDGDGVIALRRRRDLTLLRDANRVEGTTCLVSIGSGEPEPATVELVQLEADGRAARMTLAFLNPIDPAQFVGATPLEAATATVTFTTSDEELLVNVVRALHTLFELIDSARLVCDELLAQLDPKNRFVITPPVVQRLSMTSPLVLDVAVAVPPLLLVTGMITWFLRSRERYYAGSIRREEARALTIQNDLAEFGSNLEASDVAELTVRALRGSTPEPADLLDPAPQALDLERLTSLVVHQLLPAMQRLLDDSGAETRIVLEAKQERELEALTADDADVVPDEPE